MANIMTTSDNQTKADVWKMRFRGDFIRSILDYMKQVVDGVYADIALLTGGSIEQLQGEISDAVEAAVSDLMGEIAGSGTIELSYELDGPADAAVDSVLSATVLTESAQEITDGLTDPDFARRLVVVPTMQGASLSGDVVITGTDINDDEIEETFALANDASIPGNKAFKTIVSVDLPVRVTENDAISIGTTNYFGFPALLVEETIYLALVDGARDNFPDIVTDPEDVAKVLVCPDTAPDGSKKFKFFYHI